MDALSISLNYNDPLWITIALLYQKSGNTERALELLQIYVKSAQAETENY